MLYFINHLPTRTFYGIQTEENRHALVGCKHYRHAEHIGKSVASYYHQQGKLPPNNAVCVLPHKEITHDALDFNLFINYHDLQDEETFTTNIMNSNLEVIVVSDLHGPHLHLTVEHVNPVDLYNDLYKRY